MRLARHGHRQQGELHSPQARGLLAATLRRDEEVQDDGHVITRISQWDRRDWGPGGAEFHWWCTESASAFVGKTRVVDSMQEELIAMVSQPVYDRLLAYMDQRATQPKATRLAHPVLRKKS